VKRALTCSILAFFKLRGVILSKHKLYVRADALYVVYPVSITLTQIAVFSMCLKSQVP
jgi:hypothetical protein